VIKHLQPSGVEFTSVEIWL